MSALIAVVEARITSGLELPPIITHEIRAFLAAGHTGTIILNVKCGDVRSCNLNRNVDAHSPLDIGTLERQESDH